MRILYVPRLRVAEYYKKRYSLGNAWVNQIKTHALHAAADLRRKLYFSPIDGFFEASLHHAGSVVEMPYGKLRSGSHRGYDALVVHFRCGSSRLRGEDATLIEIAKGFDGAKALFIDADEAETMKGDAVLDHYDIIFKREPFIDLGRYPLRSKNQRKIRPTMLSCRYFRHSRYFFLRARKHRDLLDRESTLDGADVFFIGKATDERSFVWSALRENTELKLAGGLLPRIGFDNASALMTTPLREREFISRLKSSRISLAIDGHGQFTFRHLEVWCSGGFLLANASLRDIWLPLAMREGEHFECYDGTQDLLGKVQHFTANPAECRRIADNGRNAFDEQYDVRRHGAEIRAALSGN